MAAETVANQPWSRHHDKKGVPYVDPAPRTAYPKSLQELVELCSDPSTGQLHAAGSHWALSDAALSDFTFIETHDAREDWEAHPPGVIKPAMGSTITDVIPKCLNRTYLDWLHTRELPHYLIHVESGKRVYQLYSELDQPVNMSTDATLGGYMRVHYGNEKFAGPWGPATLGGAGGQTIVGALTTGTHGGDFDRPPIADAVCAIHLVADGGRQFWIEPAPGDIPALTDDVELQALYGTPPDFNIIRTDEMFNAALVSVGRFGVIYSVVLRAVPQYNLYEQRRYDIWQDMKHHIKNRESWLFSGQPSPVDADGDPLPEGLKPSSQPPGNPRFLQIVVCLTPIAACTENRVAITKRWELPLPDHPLGRDQRVGTLVPGADDPLINAPRFTNAGRNHPHSVDPDNPQRSADPGLFEIACMNGNFLVGLIEKAIEELEEFATSGGAIIGGGLALILIPGAGGVLMLIPALWLILQLLKEFVELVDPDNTVGSTLDEVRELLLDPPGGDLVPGAKAAGLLAWQLIGALVFGELQGPLEFEGISYAMMDRKDYKQRSCETNGDSVEVFFANNDQLIAFVDSLVSFERNQEFNGTAFVGYVSLRFMQPSRALLGEQKWPVTCSVEVAGLKDVKGSQEVVTHAHDLALNPNYNGFLHWGQKNEYQESHVAFRYGAALNQWRVALRSITDDGHHNRFSSQFTRAAGLEP